MGRDCTSGVKSQTERLPALHFLSTRARSLSFTLAPLAGLSGHRYPESVMQIPQEPNRLRLLLLAKSVLIRRKWTVLITTLCAAFAGFSIAGFQRNWRFGSLYYSR